MGDGWSGWLGGGPVTGKSDKENGHPAKEQVHTNMCLPESEENSLENCPYEIPYERFTLVLTVTDMLSGSNRSDKSRQGSAIRV